MAKLLSAGIISKPERLSQLEEEKFGTDFGTLASSAKWRYNLGKWQNGEIMDKERVIKTLSATFTLPQAVNSEVEMFDMLNQGLPVATLIAMQDQGIVDVAELKTFISARTLARRKGEQKRLTAEESDLIARLARIHDFAIEVFGTHEKARKWLRTPNRALKNHLPLDLLRTDYGARIVESILGRIAHGIFS